MAQENSALKVIALVPEGNGAKDEIGECAKSRRNPILRYDQMFVSNTLNMYIEEALRLIPSEDMICKGQSNQEGDGVEV